MLNKLKKFLSKYTSEGIALAYSGGVDSSFLLTVLQILQKEHSFPLIAVHMHSVFQHPDEFRRIRQPTKDCNIEVKIIHYDPLAIPELKQNPPDRCYWCKHHIFARIRTFADYKGIKTVMDGTNFDDKNNYRPGLRALDEWQVISPLAEIGFTKNDIRLLAKNLNLEYADKPSSSCMATRFEYGSTLTEELIRRVIKGEKQIRKVLPDLTDVRLRVHGGIARIEVSAQAIPMFVQQHLEIASHLKLLGFNFVTLDLEGFRSGSMDHIIKNKETGGATCRSDSRKSF